MTSRPIRAYSPQMPRSNNDGETSRRRQLFLGGLAILFVGLFAIFCWLGRFMPGFMGEWFAVLAGVFSTPFLMEGSLALLAFLLVLAINTWRHHREGDEFVYLEQVEDADGKDIPEHARWAIYDRPPLDSEGIDPVDQIEGFIEIEDYEQAEKMLGSLSAEQLKTQRILELRIRLAESTGHQELATRLRDQLHQD